MAGVEMTKMIKKGDVSRSQKTTSGYRGSQEHDSTPDPGVPDDNCLAIKELRQQYDDIRWSLQKNEFQRAQYWKVFDHAGIAAIVIDDNTTIIRANRQFEILTACRRVDVEGKMDWAWFLSGVDKETLQKIDRQLRRGPLSAARTSYELQLTDRKKNVREVEVIISRIPKTRWSLAFIRELTRNCAPEQPVGKDLVQMPGLRYSEKAGVLITDRYGRIIHVNDLAETMIGWREREIAGKPALEILKPWQETNRPITDTLIPELTRDDPVLGTLRKGTLLTKNKTRVPVTYSVLRLQAQETVGTGYVVEFSDMSVSNSPSDIREDTETSYRLMLRNPQEIIYSIDETGNIAFISPRVEMLGYLREEVLGRKFCEFVHPDDREDLDRKFKAAGKDKNRHFSLSFRIMSRQDTIFWVESTGTIRPEGAEKNICIVGVLRDISERTRKELALRETNKKLILLNSFTRHDVQNQLLALNGYLQCALDEKTAPPVTDLLARIMSSGHAIARQMDFAKTYHDLGIHTPKWFRISDIVSRTTTGIVRVTEPCRNVEVYTDPMIEQIFFNLFDNATRHGGNVSDIVVSCGPSQNGLVLTVEDNGIGIPPRDKERIFDRGYGRNSGLGLFLIREVLAITGIAIRETGEAGKGARFEILVPKGAYHMPEP
jgi:PAS domain S-box-containing protein